MGKHTTQVRVRLRGLTLAESAPLIEHEHEGSSPTQGVVFLGLDHPPPVATVLAIDEGSSTRALEVRSVVEVANGVESAGRGCFGRFVHDDVLLRHSKVGSEHCTPLEPERSATAVSSDDHGPNGESRPDVYQFAAPAPVVEAEPSTPIDINGSTERGGADEQAGSAKRRKGRRRE